MIRLSIILLAIVALTACTTQTPLGEQVADKRVTTTGQGMWRTEEVSGQSLAATCFGCHGPEGRSKAAAIPSLAGLPADYFIQVMQAYQYGGRYASIMGRIAPGFTQDEIARMAKYFTRLEFQPQAQRVSWRQVTKGRQLHRLYCRKCHGDLSKEVSNAANRLNGQWMDYLRWTLQDYLIGINQADPEMSTQLSRLVRRHGSEGLEALVNYLGSARP